MRPMLFPAIAAALGMGVLPMAAAEAEAVELVPSAIVDGDAHYPEGPQVVSGGLLVTEMPLDRIVLISETGSKKVMWHQRGCGPTSVKKIPSGGYWVLCHLGHHVLRLTDAFETASDIQQTTSGRRITFPNDGSVDHAGNLYLSSSGLFSPLAPPEGRLVYIDLEAGTASNLADRIRYSNGVLVQEKLKRVLVSEHLGRRVLVFPLLGKGKVGNPAIFFDFGNAPRVDNAYELGGPDGLAELANGRIAVADYGNGRILLLSSEGRYLNQAAVDYKFITNFAVSPDRRSVYVTMTEDNATEDLKGVVQKFRLVSRAR